MTGLRSKLLAIAMVLSVSLFFGPRSTIVTHAAPLPAVPAASQQQNPQGENGPGQTGEFEGENEDKGLAANNANDRDVETDTEAQEGPEVQADRQEDIQEDLQEDLQQDLQEDLQEMTHVSPPQL